ncbi:MAG: formate dehydrogenase accessory sulfurtransferase FdhD [Opitutaceae bacterium]
MKTPSDTVLKPSTGITVSRLTSSNPPETRMDQVATEEPLEIRIEGKSLAVLMRTPGSDRELAAGFLCSEGLVSSPDAIRDITRCAPDSGEPSPDAIHVHLDPEVRFDWDRVQRHTFASSSCGLCGKATIESVRQTFPPIHSHLAVSRSVLNSLPAHLRRNQATFEQTGGLHAAGLFDSNGALRALFEDVGRHNAVDKLIGSLFLRRELPLGDAILLLSGRVSFEVMQKALSAGIPLVAAISAPTSLAIAFAEASGQTLVGFLRDDRMNVYTRPERIR